MAWLDADLQLHASVGGRSGRPAVFQFSVLPDLEAHAWAEPPGCGLAGSLTKLAPLDRALQHLSRC